MQVSFGMGFIGIAHDLVNLLRVLLVNPTYGSDMYSECAAAIPKGDPSLSSDVLHLAPRHLDDFPGQPPDETPDHPRQRFWARRFSDFMYLAFLGAIIPGVIANSRFSLAIDDEAAEDRTMTLRFVSFHLVLDVSLTDWWAYPRYVSNGVALFLNSILAGGAAWARLKQPRVSKRGVSMLFSLTLLLVCHILAQNCSFIYSPPSVCGCHLSSFSNVPYDHLYYVDSARIAQ